MSGILLLISRFRSEVALLSAIGVSLCLMTVLPEGGRSAVSRVVALAFYPPRAVFATVEEMRVLRVRHEDAVRDLARTRRELDRFGEIDAENQRLRAVLSFQDEADRPLLAARVIATQGDMRAGDLAFTIDRGIRDGVTRGAPVITPSGLVGRIARVNDLDSVVKPVFSREIAVSAYDQKTRLVGMARWREGSDLILDHVPIHGRVGLGDLVLTSGLGGVYPRGIRVGRVAGVSVDAFEVFLKVVIVPSVNFHRLEEVLVILESDVAPDSVSFDDVHQLLRVGEVEP